MNRIHRLDPRQLACASIMLIATVAPTLGCGEPFAPDTAQQEARSAAPDSVVEAPPLPTIRLMNAFPGLKLDRPVFLTHAGDGTGRLFVVEQQGTIRVFPNQADITYAPIFLDLREPTLRRHNEEGLLALAFHPDYASNGYFYVYYSANNPRRGVISRFSVSKDDPNKADPESEKVILEVEQPWGNHNGSTLAFGHDGYLYISLGDGGAANDPRNHGQNLGTLLGTILRIDVDNEDAGLAYAIPADNPFVDREGARGEIWAYGLRNVWRMSFDRETGELWAGDVGQNKYEEVDLIERGGNYGWPIREGKHPFKPDLDAPTPPIDPIVEYSHQLGLSITGGYVYRGTRMDKLVGAYLYGDYVTGRIWALRHQDGKLIAHKEVFPLDARPTIASFGEDASGELYICSFDYLDGRGGNSGKIYRIEQN